MFEISITIRWKTNKLYNSQTHVTFQRVISNAISTKWRRSKEHPHIAKLNPTDTDTQLNIHPYIAALYMRLRCVNRTTTTLTTNCS